MENYVNFNELSDSYKIGIDSDFTDLLQVNKFARKADNSYDFKVGDMPVKVSFAENEVTLQDCLLKILQGKLS